VRVWEGILQSCGIGIDKKAEGLTKDLLCQFWLAWVCVSDLSKARNCRRTMQRPFPPALNFLIFANRKGKELIPAHGLIVEAHCGDIGPKDILLSLKMQYGL
jgi:hypothetical protein